MNHVDQLLPHASRSQNRCRCAGAVLGLSDIGKARAEAFAARDLLPENAIFVSSEETKAEELAEILAARHGNPIITRPEFNESDRSAVGFTSTEDFQSRLARFYRYPDQSADGWETAIATQKRIVAAVTVALGEFGNTPLVFTGHGTIGTLLKCHMGKRAIAQAEDQRLMAHAGGGNLFAFDLAAKRLLCEWTSFENWKGS